MKVQHDNFVVSFLFVPYASNSNLNLNLNFIFVSSLYFHDDDDVADVNAAVNDDAVHTVLMTISYWHEYVLRDV